MSGLTLEKLGWEEAVGPTGLTLEKLGVSPDSFDSFAPEIEERPGEKKPSGFLRSTVSAIAGGITDIGEMYTRAGRALPGGAEAGKDEGISGSTLKEIDRLRAKYPMLAERDTSGVRGALYGGLRSAVTSLGARAPGMAAGAAIGAAVSGPAAPAGAFIGGAAGFLLGGPLFGMAEYDSAMEEGLKSERYKEGKITKSEIESSAIKRAAHETGWEFVSDALTIATMGGGMAVTAGGKEALKQSAKEIFKSSGKQVGKRMAVIAGAETGTELLTAGFQTEERRKLGLTDETFLEGARRAFGPAFVASLIFGGISEGGIKLSRRETLKNLENPSANIELRQAAVKETARAISSVSPEIAQSWKTYADQAVLNGEPITTNEESIDETAKRYESVPKRDEGKQKVIDSALGEDKDLSSKEILTGERDRARDLINVIDEGMSIGEIRGTVFTSDHALDLIQEGYSREILNDADIEKFRERYPDLMVTPYSPEMAEGLRGPEALPPGQGFELIEPTPETRLKKAPPTYPEDAEYVAGKEAPEGLEVEHKPFLTAKEKPWVRKDQAFLAMDSKRLKDKGVTRATHKVIKVRGGFGIIKKVVETAEDRKKADEAFEKADKAIRDKYTGKAPPVPDVFQKAQADAKAGKTRTLLSFVRAMGGIKDASLPGEIRALSGKETGVIGLTTKRTDKGLGFDEMAAAAVEHGWLTENLENESGAFSELLRDDIFAQKEKKQRVERLEDIAKRTEREERWDEFKRSEDEELEYFAKHPEEEINADLDQWQRESIIEIRSQNDASAAREIEENSKSQGKIEARSETPGLVGSEKDEGWAEFSEAWDKNDALDENTLAELEEWRVMQEGEGIAVMAKESAKEEKLKAVSKKVKTETPSMLKESDKVNDVTLGTLVDMASEDPVKALEHAADATVSKAKLIEGLKNKGLKAMGEAKSKEERAEIKRNLEETLRGIEEGKKPDVSDMPKLPKGDFDNEIKALNQYLVEHDPKKGQIPAKKPYLKTRDEEFAKIVGDVDTQASNVADGVEDVRQAIWIGEKLGYHPNDIARYLKQNYVEGVPNGGKIVPQIEKSKEPILREPEVPYAVAQTKTPAFKKWFKDSKVVDEKDEPLVVYHGTDKSFAEFSTEKGRLHKFLEGTDAFFFTSDLESAEFYAYEGSVDLEMDRESPQVYSVYLSIQNPLFIKDISGIADNILDPQVDELIEEAREEGNDGLIVQGKGGFKDRTFVVFSPPQIKSATGNIGTFLETDPSILKEPSARYKQSELDVAFGGKKKADEAIESVAKEVEAVSRRGMPDRVAGKPAKSKVAEEIRKKKYVDFIGRKLTAGNESQEIAELFQVYRSPKMEILHAIYTSKDGTILGHNAMTSGDMGAVRPENKAKYIYQMQSAAKRLGAAKVHILHNHPSGNPTMSREDVNFASALHRQPTPERNALGDLMGEFIVIDHGKFTWVSEYGQHEGRSYAYADEGTYKVIPSTGEWMTKKGRRLTGPEATASFGQSLAFDKSKACFVYVDGNNNIVGWSTHDKDILKKENLREIVKQQAKGHDAARAVILVHDIKDVKQIVTWAKSGLESWLLDAQDAKGYSLREALPLSFERRGRKEPTKPAWGLFEPEAPYGGKRDLRKWASDLIDDLEKPSKTKKADIAKEKIETEKEYAGIKQERTFQETLEPVTVEDYASNRKANKDIKLTAKTNARRVASEIAEGVDKFLGSISTRLGQVSLKLKAKLRKLDFDINTKYADDIKTVYPLLKKAKKMSRNDFADWDYARKNSDVEKINELISKYGMEKEYAAYRKTLDRLRKEGFDVGLVIGEIEEYAPRILKDSRGFLTAIGKAEEWPIYSRKLQERANELGVSMAEMTPDMKADIVSNMILGGWSGLGGIPATKQRVLKKIPADLNKYYMDSDGALMQHLYSMRKGIEARKFFGKIPTKVVEMRKRLYAAQSKIRELGNQLKDNLPKNELEELKKKRNKYIGLEKQYSAYIAKYALQRDYTENIGSYVMELINKKEINPQHERVVNEILNARFHEAGTRGLIQAYKNLSYIDTMGSPISALTQIGDLAWAIYEGGFIRAGKHAFRAAIGKSRITKEDVGVTRIAQEFADSGTLGDAVTKVFKVVGLEKIDSIGKESLLNSALEVYQKQAKNNPAKLKKRIRPIFEAETDSVIEDLVSDEISDNVKLLVYSRLLDFQPVGLSEMPQRYLDAGNGRLFYMLKTFTIKVFDVFRNESYNKIKTGDKAEKVQGIKNLIRLSMIFILANATADELKDWVLGRKTDFSDRAIDNILRLFGVSKFVTWKARTEGVGSALARQILPPFKFIDSAGKDIITAGDEKGLEVVGSIPIVGKLTYWHMGRGVSKRGDLWDRRLRKRKAKLNKIKDDSEKAKDKTAFIHKYKKELRELQAVNRLQGRLNKHRSKINRLKSAAESPERKKSIQKLENERTELIKKFLKGTEKKIQQKEMTNWLLKEYRLSLE